MATPVSILITTNDNSTSLRDTLPEILAQQYVGEYEVVVVRETRRGAVKDLLEPLLSNHPNLHTTYLPDHPQYVTGEEVELLLGVKAAKHDHIIMVSSDFLPDSDQWLTTAAATLGDGEEGQALPDEAPVRLGDEHYHSRLGLLQRRKHRKTVMRLLKPWCKAKDVRCATLLLPKATRHLLAIAFRRDDYLSDIQLREVIAKHVSVTNI